jgi:hypothetical protein
MARVRASARRSCELYPGAYLRFDKDALSWGGDEVGVTKFTTLSTNYPWIIEELL